KKDASFCKSNLETVKRLAQTVKPRDEEDNTLKMATSPIMLPASAAGCFARAGDCETAFKTWKEGQEEMMPGALAAQTELQQRQSFIAAQPLCKSWVESKPVSPHDQLVRA